MNGDMLTYGSDFNLILDNRTNSGAAVSVVHPLGDIDLDGRLTVDDVDMLQSLTHSGKILRRADLDENYTLDANDVRVLTEDIIGISPGDANLDRSVDTMDFTIWMAKRFVADTYWSSGDFNSDGVTNVSDFKIWNDNRFRSAKTRDVEFNRRLPRAPLPHGDQGRRTTTEIQIDRPAPPP